MSKQTTADFARSSYRNKLTARFRAATPQLYDGIEIRIAEVEAAIGRDIEHYIERKASVLRTRNRETLLRKGGRKLALEMLKLASMLEKAPFEVLAFVFSESEVLKYVKVRSAQLDRNRDETASVPSSGPSLEDNPRIIGQHLKRCGAEWLQACTGKRGNPKLIEERHLIGGVMVSWEKVTGRFADGTETRERLAADGYPAFRESADVIQAYINSRAGTDDTLKITDEKMNTVIGAIIDARRAFAQPKRKPRKKK